MPALLTRISTPDWPMSDHYLVYKSKRHRLGDGVCVLGRDPECCHISFDDKELSRKHVLIIKDGNRYMLIDFRSTNGVFVNDKPQEQVHLRNNDMIKIGQQQIQYVEEGAPSKVPIQNSGRTSLSGRFADRGSGVHASGSLTRILNIKSVMDAVVPEPAVTSQDPANLTRKLASLIKVGRVLNSELNLTELLNKVLDYALQVMRADRGLLLLVDQTTGKMVPRVHREMENLMQQRDPAGHISRSILEHVGTSKDAVLVKDALADQRFSSSLSIQMFNIRSALCVPLVNRDKFLGALYVDNRIESFSFSEDDKELLMAFADQAAIGIENAALVEERQEEMRKRMTLSRYLSRNVVDTILAHKGDLALEGKKVRATILFADIRGFTSFSEAHEPQHVVQFLNDFLTKMTRSIFNRHGTLDKYLGDGLMAVFGAPFPQEDSPYWAIQAALEMQTIMAANVAIWEQQFGFTGRLGVGINTGEVTCGNIGSEDRLDFTVIGDAVNLAARLQAMATRGDVVISEQTKSEVEGRFAVETLGRMQVKGKAREVEVFRILGLSDRKDIAPDDDTPP